VEKWVVEILTLRIDLALPLLDVAIFGTEMTFLQTGEMNPLRPAET
jgi:hypothetical protein